jgi:hypothetical protein
MPTSKFLKDIPIYVYYMLTNYNITMLLISGVRVDGDNILNYLIKLGRGDVAYDR